MIPAIASERDLARVIVAWFTDLKWDVYQEVTHLGDIADIVVTQGPKLGVIECKMAFGLPVLGQCHRWKQRSNLTWAAVPWGGRSFAEDVAATFGIGVLRVRMSSEYTGGKLIEIPIVEEVRAPEFRRRTFDGLRDALRPEHADGTYAAAGTQSGDRFSPFKSTCRELLRVVSAEPGLTLKDAVDRIRHHYGTPKAAVSSLSHWLDAGSIAGVEMRREQRRLRLYPAQEARS